MKAIIASVLALAVAAPAVAKSVSVNDCDEKDSIQALVEPWEKNSRRFYNDKVRIAYLDTGGEPACCSGWLIVIMPNPVEENEPMEGPVCKLIGNKGGTGFLGVGFENLKAEYDPKKGLLVTFPFQEYNPDGDGVTHNSRIGKFRLNLQKGTVTPE